ncbi:MAG: hypothetical protein KW793_01340 [Candidatus Doudnabacteria bacterium]|nr:hypothetical protein [Candidatus Doudnabacteria bacterium]
MSGYSKLVTYILGGVALIAAVFFFLLNPALKRVASLANEQLQTKAEAERLEQQIMAYKTAQSDLSKAVNKELLYATVIDDKKLYIPIQEMEAGAKATESTYQLKILRDSIDDVTQADLAPAERRKVASGEGFKKVTSQNLLEEVPYTLIIQNASYPQIMSFLKYLEHIPHFTEVSKISMSMQEIPETERLAITATIDGVYLVKKNETTPE